MDILRIIYRIFLNVWKDIPMTPHQLRVAFRLRRRTQSWRIQELDRLDRLRNPSKYRGL